MKKEKKIILGRDWSQPFSVHPPFFGTCRAGVSRIMQNVSFRDISLGCITQQQKQY